MRMWMLTPDILCRQHLLGEHNELHMLAGCIRLNKSLKGYIEKGHIAVHLARIRHEQLVQEFERRGYNHKSPFPDIELWEEGEIDFERNIRDLCDRCPECAARYHRYKENQNVWLAA